MLAMAMLVAVVLGPVQAFNEGNHLYAEKDYAGAAKAYEQALRAGHDACVHYNLGNALFRSGQIGAAIVNYRRAYYLTPRDPDIQGNLAFARAYRVDKSATSPSPLARAADRALRWMSRREASVLAGISFALAALAMALWIVWRRAVLGAGASLFGALWLFCFVVQQVWAGEVAARPAVIALSEVSAASGPGEEFKQVMLLHDGTEVRIREARGDYLLVQLPGGGGGWLKRGAVQEVY